MNKDVLPIVRLEIDFLAERITHAMAIHRETLDKYVNEAVQAACSEENIKRIVDQRTKHELDKALQRELEQTFLYGRGRDIIKQAVNELLNSTRRETHP